MSWRSLIIRQGGRLSLHHKQLRIQQESRDVTVPIEDIAVIVIENREVQLTVALLSALAQAGVTVLTCDEQFLPCGQWLPFNQYHRQLKILNYQLSMSLPFQKQLWQRIIRQKIYNQARVLSYIGQEKESEKLLALVSQVKSGDKDNIEAQAAAFYFKVLFGKTFRRWSENILSSHLNYAYTVLRAAVARSLVQYGWQPSLGLFHHNELNAFNLADDFFEPFRPIVDLKVWSLWQDKTLQEDLSPQAKQTLIALLHYQMGIEKQVVSVLTAIDKTVASFRGAVEAKDSAFLKLPEVMILKEFVYE